MIVRLTPRLKALGALALSSAFLVAACSSEDSNSGDDTGVDAGDDETDAAVGQMDDDPPGDDDPSPGPDGGGDAEDGGAPDGGGSPDGGALVNECEGKADGEECPDGICQGEACTPSRCGDGFVDARLNEDCDDENAVSGDGCNLCRFDCEEAADCDDDNWCNGVEECTKNACVAGTPEAENAACDIDALTKGVCRSGQCAAVGCGNTTVDAGEDCDDGNQNDADGCTAKCEWTCAADGECNNNDACDGVETCDLPTHTCKPGTAVVCDAKGCTGTCEPSDGSCSYPDADQDGSTCEVDCSDADPARFPGAFECKDAKDNDCNPDTADTSAPGCECYVDIDNDGFALNTNSPIASGGSCPAGYTRTLPGKGTTDCAPWTTAAFPGQTAYFETAYCPSLLCFNPAARSFDYNCDGDEESPFRDGKLGPATCASLKNARACSLAGGWVTTVPECGGTGTFRSCTWVNDACSGQDIADRVRPCR